MNNIHMKVITTPPHSHTILPGSAAPKVQALGLNLLPGFVANACQIASLEYMASASLAQLVRA